MQAYIDLEAGCSTEDECDDLEPSPKRTRVDAFDQQVPLHEPETRMPLFDEAFSITLDMTRLPVPPAHVEGAPPNYKSARENKKHVFKPSNGPNGRLVGRNTYQNTKSDVLENIVGKGYAEIDLDRMAAGAFGYLSELCGCSRLVQFWNDCQSNKVNLREQIACELGGVDLKTVKHKERPVWGVLNNKLHARLKTSSMLFGEKIKSRTLHDMYVAVYDTVVNIVLADTYGDRIINKLESNPYNSILELYKRIADTTGQHNDELEEHLSDLVYSTTQSGWSPWTNNEYDFLADFLGESIVRSYTDAVGYTGKNLVAFHAYVGDTLDHIHPNSDCIGLFEMFNKVKQHYTNQEITKHPLPGAMVNLCVNEFEQPLMQELYRRIQSLGPDGPAIVTYKNDGFALLMPNAAATQRDAVQILRASLDMTDITQFARFSLDCRPQQGTDDYLQVSQLPSASLFAHTDEPKQIDFKNRAIEIMVEYAKMTGILRLVVDDSTFWKKIRVLFIKPRKTFGDGKHAAYSQYIRIPGESVGKKITERDYCDLAIKHIDPEFFTPWSRQTTGNTREEVSKWLICQDDDEFPRLSMRENTANGSYVAYADGILDAVELKTIGVEVYETMQHSSTAEREEYLNNCRHRYFFPYDGDAPINKDTNKPPIVIDASHIQKTAPAYINLRLDRTNILKATFFQMIGGIPLERDEDLDQRQERGLRSLAAIIGFGMGMCNMLVDVGTRVLLLIGNVLYTVPKLEAFKGVLMQYGEPGTGKTLLQAMVANFIGVSNVLAPQETNNGANQFTLEKAPDKTVAVFTDLAQPLWKSFPQWKTICLQEVFTSEKKGGAITVSNMPETELETKKGLKEWSSLLLVHILTNYPQVVIRATTGKGPDIAMERRFFPIHHQHVIKNRDPRLSQRANGAAGDDHAHDECWMCIFESGVMSATLQATSIEMACLFKNESGLGFWEEQSKCLYRESKDTYLEENCGKLWVNEHLRKIDPTPGNPVAGVVAFSAVYDRMKEDSPNEKITQASFAESIRDAGYDIIMIETCTAAVDKHFGTIAHAFSRRCLRDCRTHAGLATRTRPRAIAFAEMAI